MKSLFLSLLLICFSIVGFSQNLALKKSIQGFKDRALCKCIASGLDSNKNYNEVQKLIPFDPIAHLFYDSIIDKSLKTVMKEMYADSAQRVNTVSVNAQGKMVFYFCMKYYKSLKLDSIAKRRSKEISKIKNLEEYILLKLPGF